MSSRRRTLVVAALALLAVVVIHDLDHTLRQSASPPSATSLLGTTGLVATIVTAGLALAGRRLAAPALALVGLGTAVGFLAVHAAPDWGPFSQPYEAIGADAVSWLAMLVPVLVAAAVGVVAVRELRAGRAGPSRVA